MAVLQDFKCPGCGGAMEFDSGLQKMKCPYCDSEFDMAELQTENDAAGGQAEGEMQWNTDGGAQWQPGETDGMRVYVCNSCGGEIVGDETTAATECPFCGNSVVMAGQFSGTVKPELVIPFKLDKKAAKEALKKHYSGKKFLPKVFKDENRIEEIKGLYVPVWLFTADAQGRVQYEATQVRTWSDSDYDYTETKYYNVVRGGNLGFENVPVDSSSKMDDTLMESIEPFNASEAVAFQTAYLAGYLADKEDVDAESSIQRANERIKQSTEQAFAATVDGYTSVRPTGSNIALSNGTNKYALYPVWILTTQWKGKKYTFAMNGQTGKLVGGLPMDKGAFWRWFLGLTGVVSAIAFGISYLLWLL